MISRGFRGQIVAISLVWFLGVSGWVHADQNGNTLLPGSFTELAKRVSPSVVNISSSKAVDMVMKGSPKQPGPGDPSEKEWQEFFERFFGKSPQMPRGKQNSLGSGFILDADGYIVTNNHVVTNAEDIRVQLSNKQQYDAKLIGIDKKTDLALIKINTKEKLTPVTLGNSDGLDIGQWVVAIGNPFGLGNTVTAGIVSAKGRIINMGPYDDFIQTDASINPGNSGGPLFNLNGEVVGINTAIVASGQGIGFAIPINLAKNLLPQLKDSGKIVRGWLGVLIQEVDPDLAKAFGMDKTGGALVSEVMAKSPAQHAGMKRGDIIVRFDDKKIEEMHDLPRLVAGTALGKKVKLEVIRDGKPLNMMVTIEKLQEDEMERVRKKEPKSDPNVFSQLGMTLEELTPELARHLQLKGTKGLVVKDVEEGSPAAEAGLRNGDIILEVNQVTVEKISEFQKALKKGRSKAIVVLLVKRDGPPLYLTLKQRK